MTDTTDIRSPTFDKLLDDMNNAIQYELRRMQEIGAIDGEVVAKIDVELDKVMDDNDVERIAPKFGYKVTTSIHLRTKAESAYSRNSLVFMDDEGRETGPFILKRLDGQIDIDDIINGEAGAC